MRNKPLEETKQRSEMKEIRKKAALRNKLDHFVQNIPDLKQEPLCYVFETLKYKHKENTIWLELGVCRGVSLNYISKFTTSKVYGFDSFEGLPAIKHTDGPWHKGQFNIRGQLPKVDENVVLIKGWFDPKLAEFVNEHPQKISFIHMDCDIYSSTKYALDTFKNQLSEDCVIVFDEMLHYPGCENHQLLAFYEFVNENSVEYEWIGRWHLKGSKVFHKTPGKHQSVAVKIINVGTAPTLEEEMSLFNEYCHSNSHRIIKGD